MAEKNMQMEQAQEQAGGMKPEKKQTGQSQREIRVGFVGNPNCGKTTLFNAFTGANLKVANWPGVTVERVEGRTSYKGRSIKVIDLPGIYSLTSYTMEETVSRQFILSDERKSRKVFRLPLSGHWNVPLKAAFCRSDLQEKE